jgi:hypothetical protein
MNRIDNKARVVNIELEKNNYKWFFVVIVGVVLLFLIYKSLNNKKSILLE